MEPIKIEDLLSYRFVSGVKAAPKGERAVFVVRSVDEKKDAYESDIYLYENGAVRRLTADGKSNSPIWEDETHILFPAMRSAEDQERVKNGERFSCFYRLDIRGGEAVKAFEIPVSCGNLQRLDDDMWFFIAGIDRAEPDEYKMTAEERQGLAERRKEDADYHILTDAVYRMNGAGFQENTASALFTFCPSTGETKRVTDPWEDVFFARKWGGEIVFAAPKYRKIGNMYSELYAYDPGSGVTRTLYAHADLGISDVYALPGSLLVLASDFREYGWNQNPGIYRLTDGSLEPVIAPDVSFGTSVGSDCRLGGGSSTQVVGEELYFSCTVGGRCELRKLTASGKQVTLHNAEGSLDGFSVTEKGTVFGTGLFDNKLTELYQLGRGRKHTCLTDFNDEALKGKYVAVPQKLSAYSAGRRIDGWVLLPKDFDETRKYPAVLDIHGGPKTVYGEVLYHEMQVWASESYFVFFCNPTGSDGRGDAFADLRGRYGTVDYRNLMDFTDAVLKQWPQIDPERVAVTGGSYGGFMTNWIIGHTDRFACAASQRSISNWFSFYGVSDCGIPFGNDQNAANIFDGQKQIWAHSPLKYAGSVKTPTLFIHADEDYRCPIDQGLQMYTALVERGIDTRFVWFKGENHDLSRSGKPKHRIRRLREITDWIEKYTKE